ncbi:hypothetical protein [Streptomyces sp. NPDC000878]
MPFVTSRRDSIQYDGTNGAEIAGTWCTGISFVSDSGTVLTFKDRDDRVQTASVNDWLIISGVEDGNPTVLSTADYETYFVEIPPMPS